MYKDEEEGRAARTASSRVPLCAAAPPVFGQLMAKSGAEQYEDRDGPSH